MNLDGAFLFSLAKEGKTAVLRAKSLGITGEDIEEPEGQDALNFMYEAVALYGQAPPPDIVIAKTGADLEEHAASADLIIDEMLKKKLMFRMQRGLTTSVEFLDNGDPRGSFDHTETLIREVRSAQIVHSPVESLFALGPDVLQDYEDIKAGKRGIQTRWPTINKATLGFWPQDLVLFVARVATGKTWASIMMAHDAWSGMWCEWDGMDLHILYRKECQAPAYDDEQGNRRKCEWIGPSRRVIDSEDKCPRCGGEVRAKGHRVLYVTTEVSKKRIASRFFSVRYQLPYYAMRSGRLNPNDENKLKRGVEHLREAGGLAIVGGDFDFTIGGLEAAVEQAEPELVVLDGAYLMRGSGKTRTDQAANVFNDLKRMFQRTGLAGVVTSQLNRSANPAQRNTVSTESIALTDVAGWNSDMVVGMIQDEDMRDAKRMYFKPLKVREGVGEEIEVNWDFTSMNFDELPRMSVDDDFDTSVTVEDEEGQVGEDKVPF